MKKNQLLSIFTIFLCTTLMGKEYQISDYGARKNSLSTVAIQKTIDAAAAAGGGKVIVPTGTYITGTLELKSFVELHLESGAVLEGSLNLDDYKTTFRLHGMIYCFDQTNVAISGLGTIQARGIEFYDSTQNHVYEEFNRSVTRQKEGYQPLDQFSTDGPIKRKPKPGMTIEFYHSSQVKLTGITIKDTPNWAVRIGYCDDVLVHGISLYNNLLIPNSDGVHLTTSRNVRVSDCDIRSGDDSFIITGFSLHDEEAGFSMDEQMACKHGNKTEYAENITVSNCTFQSRSAGIRVGYGQHPIRHCTFSNIVIHGSNRGIGIFAHDSSSIEDLEFNNFTIETSLHNGQWWGNGEPIHLSSITRFEGEATGAIKRVRFSNISATSDQGIVIWGDKPGTMEEISFDNVRLKITKGKEMLTYGGNIDLRPAAEKDKQIFEHDISGLYAFQVNDLRIEDFDLVWDDKLAPWYTHGIHTERVNDLVIEGFYGRGNPTAPVALSIYTEDSNYRSKNY